MFNNFNYLYLSHYYENEYYIMILTSSTFLSFYILRAMIHLIKYRSGNVTLGRICTLFICEKLQSKKKTKQKKNVKENNNMNH